MLWLTALRQYVIRNGVNVEGIAFNDGRAGFFSRYQFATQSGEIITGGAILPTAISGNLTPVNIVYHPKRPKTFIVNDPKTSSKQFLYSWLVIGAFILFLFVHGYNKIAQESKEKHQKSVVFFSQYKILRSLPFQREVNNLLF
jgi:hypothetical protein